MLLGAQRDPLARKLLSDTRQCSALKGSKAFTTGDTEEHRGNRRLINVDMFDALHRGVRGHLLTDAVSRTPISGTVFPTTAAIWRTCSIKTSN